MNTRIENTDYMLIPVDTDDQSWNIRILQGEFTETVIAFGNVSIDADNDALNFNFEVVSSPINSLTCDDVDLQLEAGDILSAVLNEALEAKSLQLVDEKDGTNLEY